MKSDLLDAVSAIQLSRAVIKNIKENLFWAFCYNAIGIPLAAGVFYPLLGWQLSPMFGSAAMSFSSVFVVTNALRLKGFKPSFKKGKQEIEPEELHIAAEPVPEKKEKKEMKIAIANDHSAVELKNIIKEHLESNGYEVLNLGTDSTESCDYPVYGEKVGRAVADGEADLGIAICGTGVGISLAANKVKGIRACVCSEPYTAKLSRMHNNSNILAFGARVVGSELAKMIVDEWLGASFEGGRHQRRVDMLMDIENK